MADNTKSAVQSKTIWTNVIIVVGILVAGFSTPAATEFLRANAEWAIGILGILNIVLRFLTAQPINTTGTSED